MGAYWSHKEANGGYGDHVGPHKGTARDKLGDMGVTLEGRVTLGSCKGHKGVTLGHAGVIGVIGGHMGVRWEAT